MVDSLCSAKRPWIRKRQTLGVLVDQAHVLLDAAADDLASRIGGEVDGREDRGPQHVAQPLTDRLEQIRFVGEMSINLRFRGAGLFGDLAEAQIGSEPVDRAEGGVDDLRAHLLAMLAPALAAGVHLDTRLAAGT